jgi:hypothetical protein
MNTPCDKHRGNLSSRLRAGSECAPWVIEEVHRLETALKLMHSGNINMAARFAVGEYLPSIDWDDSWCRTTPKAEIRRVVNEVERVANEHRDVAQALRDFSDRTMKAAKP